MDDDKEVEVSIVIRAYNSQDTVARAIDSALSQSNVLVPYEVLIVDDGSKDATRSIIDTYENDKRVRIIHQENMGAVPAANIGFREARGVYVVLLDADDEFLPNFLSETIGALHSDSSLDFVYADYFEEFDGARVEVNIANLMQTIAEGVVFRKELLAQVGFYRESVMFAEYDLLLRTWRTWHGAHVPKPLFVYHRRANSISANNEWVRKAIEQLAELYPDRLAEVRAMRSYSLNHV